MRAQRSVGLTLLGVLLAAALATVGAAPPTPGPTAQQRARLQERDRLLAQAQQLAQAGQLAEAIKAAQKMLALERAVFGDFHEEVAGSLDLLASWHEARNDFASASRARKEVLAIQRRLHG